MGGCKPCAFLIGLPFALLSLIFSLLGAVVWTIGSVVTCICPCCICCAGVANASMSLVKLPIEIIQWFIDLIPC